MILILLSTLKAWINNETQPGKEQIYQQLLTPRVWPVSLSSSCLSSKPPVFLFFRDKWSLYNISHIVVGWHEDLFCGFLYRKAKEFLPFLLLFWCTGGRFLIKKDTLCVLRYKWYFARKRINMSFIEVKEEWYWRVEYPARLLLLWLASERRASSSIVTWLMELADNNGTQKVSCLQYFNCSNIASGWNARTEPWQQCESFDLIFFRK